jgi:hypothetical protein
LREGEEKGGTPPSPQSLALYYRLMTYLPELAQQQGVEVPVVFGEDVPGGRGGGLRWLA